MADNFNNKTPWEPRYFDPSIKADIAGLKDGGTADTWNKSKCRKIHICMI